MRICTGKYIITRDIITVCGLGPLAPSGVPRSQEVESVLALMCGISASNFSEYFKGILWIFLCSHNSAKQTVPKEDFWPFDQARREPQRGPGKHSCGAPKHFHGARLGRKFLNFFFQNGAFWCTLYF